MRKRTEKRIKGRRMRTGFRIVPRHLQVRPLDREKRE